MHIATRFFFVCLVFNAAFNIISHITVASSRTHFLGFKPVYANSLLVVSNYPHLKQRWITTCLSLNWWPSIHKPVTLPTELASQYYATRLTWMIYKIFMYLPTKDQSNVLGCFAFKTSCTTISHFETFHFNKWRYWYKGGYPSTHIVDTVPNLWVKVSKYGDERFSFLSQTETCQVSSKV